jgi:hypothetical protein
MPTFATPLTSPARMSAIGTAVTDGGLAKSRHQSGVGDGLSASNAYSLSFIVATYSTSRRLPLIATSDTYKG